MPQHIKNRDLIDFLSQEKDLMDRYVQAKKIEENRILSFKIHQYYLDSVDRYPEDMQERIKQDYNQFVETLSKLKDGKISLRDALDDINKSKDKQMASDDFQNLLKAAYILGCVVFGVACFAAIFTLGIPLMQTSMALEGVIVSLACAAACWSSLASAFKNEPYFQKPHHDACKHKTELLSFFNKSTSTETPQVTVKTTNNDETILNIYPEFQCVCSWRCHE